jgi:hypothetical protein
MGKLQCVRALIRVGERKYTRYYLNHPSEAVRGERSSFRSSELRRGLWVADAGQTSGFFHAQVLQNQLGPEFGPVVCHRELRILLCAPLYALENIGAPAFTLGLLTEGL